MKLRLMLAALGMLALCTSTGYSQSRDIGSRRLILDDGAGNLLTMSYAGPGSGTFIVPSGGGSLPPVGTVTNSTLRWNGSNWVQNTLLTAAQDGGVTLSRTTTGNAGPYYALDISHTNTNGGTISNTAVFGIRSVVTEGAGEDDEAVGGYFRAIGVPLSTAVGGRFQASGGGTNIGVEVISGGISNTGGLNNNSGGITNAGAISGATTLDANSGTFGAMNVATGANRFAGRHTTDDASADGIENVGNSLVTASSIVVATLNTNLGATQILNVVPAVGGFFVNFSTNVPDGSTFSYIIINP